MCVSALSPFAAEACCFDIKNYLYLRSAELIKEKFLYQPPSQGEKVCVFQQPLAKDENNYLRCGKLSSYPPEI